MKKTIGLLVSILVATIAISFSFTVWQSYQDVRKEMTAANKKNKTLTEKLELYRSKSMQENAKQKENKSESQTEELTDLFVQNTQLLHALYTYSSLEDRSKNIEPLISQTYYQKMNEQLSDQPEQSITSELKNYKTFQSIQASSREVTLLNEVAILTKVDKVITPQKIYVRVTYIKQKNKWVADQLLFTSIPKTAAAAEASE